MRKRINRLKNIVVKEISLCSRPAVQASKFFLFKSLNGHFNGMTDQEIEQQLQDEWKNATPEEKELVMKEIDRLNNLLDLMLLEKHLAALDPSTRKEVLASEGMGWDYDPLNGEFKKTVQKQILTPMEGSTTKSHYFDFEDGKWHKKNK
jgi:hypothetical protein